MSEQAGHVTMYTTTFCPYCVRAKSLLSRKGVDVREINLDGDHQARQELVKKTGGRRTVPQIWVGTVHVGGFDELNALDRRGKLDPLLDAQGVAAG
jgi:glutaredoxin 3